MSAPKRPRSDETPAASSEANPTRLDVKVRSLKHGPAAEKIVGELLWTTKDITENGKLSPMLDTKVRDLVKKYWNKVNDGRDMSDDDQLAMSTVMLVRRSDGQDLVAVLDGLDGVASAYDAQAQDESALSFDTLIPKTRLRH